MSEEQAYDANWWRAEKAASAERKARQTVASSLAKPGDTFLIVTEGKVTEPVYFDFLRRDLELLFVRIRIQSGDGTDPRKIVLTAKRLAMEQKIKAGKRLLKVNEPSEFDHVWAVLDTDVALRENIWNDVLQLAVARKVRLAQSTPCFEYWLLLHIVGFTTRSDLVDGAAAKSAVKHALGRDYSTNRETAKEAIGSLITNWPEAVGYAKKVRHHHEIARTPKPSNPSTEVDLLVRALNDSAPQNRRRLSVL